MTDFSELYTYLKDEQARLTAELAQLETKTHPGDERREGSPFGKREEEATEAFELEKRLALEKQLCDTLAKVDRALKKYEAGTYGICDICAQPIDEDRLKALPSASLCVKCKSAQAKDTRGRLAH
jgi:DnaK suppressor protein